MLEEEQPRNGCGDWSVKEFRFSEDMMDDARSAVRDDAPATTAKSRPDDMATKALIGAGGDYVVGRAVTTNKIGLAMIASAKLQGSHQSGVSFTKMVGWGLICYGSPQRPQGPSPSPA